MRSSANIGRRAGNVGGATKRARKCECSQRSGRPHRYHSLRSPISIVGCGRPPSTAASSRFTCSRRSPGRKPRWVARTRSGAGAEIDACVERAPRLVGCDRQIEMRDAARPDTATARHCRNPIRCRWRKRSGNDVIAGGALDVGEKMLVRLGGSDFLQRHDVRVELLENVDDACRRVAAVGADAAVDVPCRDGDRAQRCGRPVPEPASASMGRPVRRRGLARFAGAKLFRITQTNATIAAATAPSSAKVPGPGSRIAAAARSMKNDVIVTPGINPMTVPSRKSRQRMCDAPATMLTIENGPTGSMRAKIDREEAALAEPPRQIVQVSPGEGSHGLATEVASDRERERGAQGGADQRVDDAEPGSEDDRGDGDQYASAGRRPERRHEGQQDGERRPCVGAQRLGRARSAERARAMPAAG